MSNFKEHCVSEADLVFQRIPSTDNASTHKANEMYAEFREYYSPKDLGEIDETGAVPKTQIYQFLSRGPSLTRSTTERSSFPYLVPTIPANDSDFLKNGL